MDWFMEFGLFLWAVINNWAGYCTGGIVVALLWFWSTLRQQPVPRKLALFLAVLFLAVAVFNAWRQQYHKAIDATDKLVALTVPNFVVSLQMVFGAPTGDGMLVVSVVSVDNIGAPSGIKDFKVDVLLNDKVISEPEFLNPPNPMELMQPNGMKFGLQATDYFPPKAGIPIPTNGGSSGWLFNIARGISHEQLHDSTIRVSLKDFRGKSYSAERRMGGSGNTFTWPVSPIMPPPPH